MYAEMIVKDIFPDQTLVKELACNSLQEVLDLVSASFITVVHILYLTLHR